MPRSPRARTGASQRRRVVMLLLAVVVLAVGAYVFTLYRQVSGVLGERIERQPLLPTQTVACPPVGAPAAAVMATAATRRTAAARPTSSGDARNFVIVHRDSTTPGTGKPSAFLWAHVSNDRTRVDVVSFAPELRLSPEGCPVQTLRDVFARQQTPGVVAFLSGLLQVPVDHVVEVDRQGIVLLKRLLDPKVLANPIGVGDAIAEAMAHIVFDESMRGDDLQSLAFSLRDLRTTRSHTMTQPTAPGAKAAAPLTADSPPIAALRKALETDSMAAYG